MFGFVSKKELEKQKREVKRQKRENTKIKAEKIKEIAYYFIRNNISISDVLNTSQFMQEYECNIRKFDKAKKDAHETYHYSTNTSILDFVFDGATQLSNKVKESKIENEKNSFIEENKEKFQKCTTFIDLLPKETDIYCSKYASEIIDEIHLLQQKEEENKKEQERLEIEKKNEEERLKIEQKEQAQKEEIKAVENNRKVENELSEKKQKEQTCSKSIKEIEGLTLVFQKFISENKKIFFEHLNMLEDHLDKIVYLRAYISELDMTTLLRCQKKLLAILATCENKAEIQTDIDIITESFNKILGN